MTTYAVTGATGHLGRLVVEELLSRGVPAADVVAIARTPEKAADLAERGVQVREGDYDRPDTLPSALDGVQRLLLVSGSEPDARSTCSVAWCSPASGLVVSSALRMLV